MITVSELNGKTYDDSDCVFYRNLIQCAFMIAHNVYPIDMFTDGGGKLVMVFEREKHNKMMPLWIEIKNDKEIRKAIES